LPSLISPLFISRPLRSLPAELGDYHITDLASQAGTWVNGQRIPADTPTRLHPGDCVRFGAAEQGGRDFRVRMVHVSLMEANAGHRGQHGGSQRQARDGDRVAIRGSK
jgi:pSer/pThr/pTyr-binding forkhead associated (FHA) protein